MSVLARLRKHPRIAATPVIVLTEEDEPELEERLEALGALALLRKPLSEAELLRILATVFSGKVLVPQRKKILIVEDDQDLSIALRLRLGANEMDAIWAGDSNMALQAAREENPDLVLLDLGLPHGEGLTILEELKSDPSTQPIPVIVLSARDPLESRIPALDRGAKAYFQKPPNTCALLASIKDSLDSSCDPLREPNIT